MKKRTIIIIVSVAVLVLALLGLLNKCGTLNSSKGFSFTPDTPQAWNGGIDSQDTDGIKIPGFSTVYFEAGTKEAQITLANPDTNPCYFIYTLHINDPDSEPIYSSCRIDPGMAIENITLNRTLDEGKYTLYIKVAPYDLETDDPLNSALLKASLIVSN